MQGRLGWWARRLNAFMSQIKGGDCNRGYKDQAQVGSHGCDPCLVVQLRCAAEAQGRPLLLQHDSAASLL